MRAILTHRLMHQCHHKLINLENKKPLIYNSLSTDRKIRKNKKYLRLYRQVILPIRMHMKRSTSQLLSFCFSSSPLKRLKAENGYDSGCGIPYYGFKNSE